MNELVISSDTIDFKYENQEAEAKRQKFEEEEAECNELSYIEGETLAYRAIENDPDYEMLEDSVNTEIETSYDYDSNAILRTKSGRVLIKAAAESTLEIENTPHTPQPAIRKVRDCTDQIKSTCVQVQLWFACKNVRSSSSNCVSHVTT